MTIPQRTGDIEKVTINQVLEDMDVTIGDDIIMGDFDVLGWHLASKVRSRESENYKNHCAIFRPNYERGILIHSLIQKKSLFKVLEIGFGRGYVSACASLAIYGKGVEGQIVSVDPFHDQQILKLFEDAVPESVMSTIDFKAEKKTSDSYFAALDPDEKFDLVFIDGDHRYDFVKKDFENAIKHIDRGYIVMDDYHLPTKTDKDIEVANFVDTLGEEYIRKLVMTDRLLFGDDRSVEQLDYGMVLLPVGDIENE